MPDLNEQNEMHETDITWATYKELASNNRLEKDKIYFIEDLTSQSEILQDLYSVMN
jgi:hypothetical protein